MPEMRDSGIAWIGMVPKRWSIKPIRAGFEEVTEKNRCGLVQNALKFTYGSIVPKEDFDADNDDYVADTILGYTVVTPGTIMLNGLNLNFDFVSQRIGLVKDTGVITSAYISFRAIDSNGISPEFVTYLLKSYDGCKAFHNMCGGVRKILNFSELKKQYIVYPSLDEQFRIVGFLDSKCAEIDSLTADIQSQIDTLEQYKRSVITEAVTRGLNPNAEMKDSGIAWANFVPAHWISSKIKYEIFPLQRLVRSSDLVMTCFRDGEVTLRQNRREDGFTISITENGYQGVEVGDLVIHGMDAFAGAIGCSDSRGKITPVVHVCKTTGNNRFFMYVLRSMAVNDVLMSFAEGIRVRSSDFRNFNKLGKFPIEVPPVSEQNDIVDFLDQKCRKIDAIIVQKKEQIEVLAEYKKSLIFEYVTGKKEVTMA